MFPDIGVLTQHWFQNVVAKTGKKLNVEKNLAGHHSEKWRRFGAAIKEYMLTNFPNSQVPDKV